MRKRDFSVKIFSIIFSFALPSFLIFGLFFDKALARTATDSKSANITVHVDERYFGNVVAQVTKAFDFQLPNGQLAGSDITLELNQQITPLNQKLEGSYEYTGGAWDTPPMDGKWYQRTASPCWAEVMMPALSQSSSTVVSNNPDIISCDNSGTCTAKNLGTARITVGTSSISSPFYGKAYTKHPEWVDPNDHDAGVTYGECEYWRDSNPHTFEFDVPITYTVTVISDSSNQPPTASCGSITNTTSDSATLNWSFADSDKDGAQASSQIQIAADSEFNDLVYNQIIIGSSTVVTVTGLSSTETYYWRSRVTDDKGNVSNWASCGSFQLVQPFCYVVPRSSSVKVGDAQQFKAYYDSDGNGSAAVQEITESASWSVNNTGIATVDKGLATGKGVGFTNIQATCPGGILGRALIIVYSTPTGSNAVCGNGIIEEGEQCDGANLGGNTCTSLGYVKGGVLQCYPSGSANYCLFDVSGCFYSFQETIPN